MQRVTAQVAELARLREGERSGVQEEALVARGEERIDARDDTRPAVAAECAAVRIVDHRRGRHHAVGHDGRLHELIGAVDLIHDVRPREGDVDGQAGAGIHDSADLPTAGEQVQGFGVDLDRKLVQDRDVHAVPHVERVIAAILLEVERILGGLRFVGSAGVADAVRRRSIAGPP